MVAAVSVALAALLGAGVGAGVAMLLLAVAGARPNPAHPRPRRGWTRYLGVRRRLLTAGGVGLTVGLLTRWPVGALLTMLLVWW